MNYDLFPFSKVPQNSDIIIWGAAVQVEIFGQYGEIKKVCVGKTGRYSPSDSCAL
jgi:hypothetical protein|nr:hypothetical protein [uncultured Acetatifactor sp.]